MIRTLKMSVCLVVGWMAIHGVSAGTTEPTVISGSPAPSTQTWSGPEDAGLGEFRIESDAGVLLGRLDHLPGAVLPRMIVTLQGSPEHVVVNLGVDPLTDDGIVVGLEFSAAGTLTYRLRPTGAWLVRSTVSDCEAVSSHPVYDTILHILPGIEDKLAQSVAASGVEDARLATVWWLLKIVGLGPRLVEDCRMALQPHEGGCSMYYDWEEDCLSCCALNREILRGMLGATCGFIGAGLCSPGAPAALACAAAAATACQVIVHLSYQNCAEECEPKPRKPGEGSACGDPARRGVCKDSCELGETHVPGVCAGGHVCCRSGAS